MSIDIKDVITLNDNNEYIVVSKLEYENELYFYIININNDSDIKFLKLNHKNNKLIEFNNSQVLHKLLPLFLKEASKYIN